MKKYKDFKEYVEDVYYDEIFYKLKGLVWSQKDSFENENFTYVSKVDLYDIRVCGVTFKELDTGLLEIRVSVDAEIGVQGKTRYDYEESSDTRTYNVFLVGELKDGLHNVKVTKAEEYNPAKFEKGKSLSQDLVPYMYEENVEDEAEAFLKKHYPKALLQPMAVPAVEVAHGMGTVIGTNGTADEATNADYNFKNTFYVGTGTYDGEFTKLKVTGLEVKNEANSDLNTAIRVLVTDGTAWVVARPIATLGKDAYVVDADDPNTYHLATNTATTITKDAYDALNAKTAITNAETKWEIESQSGTDGIVHAAKFGKNNDVTLSVYVYYEGSDGRVYTTNLDKLSNIGVTITFDATPELHEK